MAYSNIAQVTTANTFNMWRLVTNSLSNAVNQIAGNTTYTKDDGSWVLSNGSIILSNTSGTTLTVAANATITKILTVTDIVLTGNISGSGSFPQSNAAYRQANLAYSTANSAYGVANLGYSAANSAYGAANNAANTVRVSANSISTLSGQQLNFVNSSTVTVSISAGTGTAAGNANISFTAISAGASAADAYAQANAAYTQGNTAYNQANAAYTQGNTAYNTANTSANTVQVYANSTLILSKANVNFINSATAIVNVTNNSGQANVSYSVNTAAITSLGTLTALDVSGSAANIFDTPIVSVTSNRTVTDNAAGLVLLCDSTAPTAITLTFAPAAKANFAVTIIRNGTGNVIIANTSTIQKQNTTSYTTANISSQFAAATVLYTATNKFILLGDIT